MPANVTIDFDPASRPIASHRAAAEHRLLQASRESQDQCQFALSIPPLWTLLRCCLCQLRMPPTCVQHALQPSMKWNNPRPMTYPRRLAVCAVSAGPSGSNQQRLCAPTESGAFGVCCSNRPVARYLLRTAVIHTIGRETILLATPRAIYAPNPLKNARFAGSDLRR